MKKIQTLLKSPRFEQTLMDKQPNPLKAIDLIAKVPITMVSQRKVMCDQGHPRVFLNLDSTKPVSCGYCGLRYQQIQHHH